MKRAISQNRSEKLTLADLDDLGVAAYLASMERLERELTDRWEGLQRNSYWTIDSAPVTEKYEPFQKFFNDAEILVAETIHEHFQALLRVAISHSRHLGSKSPLATLAEWIDWAESQILRVVCKFLAVDEELVKWAGCQNPQLKMSLLSNSEFSNSEFDPTSESKEDSRVLRSAEWLTGEWQEHGQSREFLLPRWTQVHHPALALRHPDESAEERSAWDAKFKAERMSRAETMQCVRQLEISFSMNIVIQIRKDRLDGLIYAGSLGQTPETPRTVQPTASHPNRSDREQLGSQFAVWNDELRRISNAAQAKRRYSEEDARKDFPDFTIWKAIDGSNLSTRRRLEFFEKSGQPFGLSENRFKLIGELTGRSSSTAYDIYKDRPDRKHRPRKH